MNPPTYADYGFDREGRRSFERRPGQAGRRALQGVVFAGALLGAIVGVFARSNSIGFGLFWGAGYGGLLGLVLGGWLVVPRVAARERMRQESSYFYLTKLWPFKEALARYERELARHNASLKLRREYWLSLRGREFEVELANLYRSIGFVASLTSATDDEGIDLWLEKDGERMIVQCKAHATPVGPATVRELFGALGHTSAQRAVLASTGGFTKRACEWSAGKPIDLIGMQEIMQLVEKANGPSFASGPFPGRTDAATLRTLHAQYPEDYPNVSELWRAEAAEALLLIQDPDKVSQLEAALATLLKAYAANDLRGMSAAHKRFEKAKRQ